MAAPLQDDIRQSKIGLTRPTETSTPLQNQINSFLEKIDELRPIFEIDRHSENEYSIVTSFQTEQYSFDIYLIFFDEKIIQKRIYFCEKGNRTNFHQLDFQMKNSHVKKLVEMIIDRFHDDIIALCNPDSEKAKEEYIEYIGSLRPVFTKPANADHSGA